MGELKELSLERIVAIDPGAVHCGLAFFLGANCYLVQEMAPEIMFYRLVTWIDEASVDTVVCESFHLYPWLSAEQSFSEMRTCEVIGVIKYLCELGKVKLVMQGADKKKVTERHMAARGIENKGNEVAGQHVKDACEHGWYYLLKGRTL